MANYTFPWNQVNTLVQDEIMPVVRDQIFVGNVFFNKLKGSQKMFSGGRSIVAPLGWKVEGGGGQWFSGPDVIDTTIRDTIQAATFTPKNLIVPIAIDWESLMTVDGPQKVMDLMASKMDIAKNTILDTFNQALYNDGSSPQQVTGLQYALKDFSGTTPPTMTYGGISRSSTVNTWWNHNGDGTAYTSGSTGLANTNLGYLAYGFAQCFLRSAKQPNLILSNIGAWTDYHYALIKNERYGKPQRDTATYDSGFENLLYRGAPWVVDPRAPRSSAKVEHVYMLNTDAIRLYTHSQANFEYIPFREPYNQMAKVAYIVYRGELIVVEPRTCHVVSSVDTSNVS